jgi:transcriptional regulator with XRE-family HTH domain
MDEPRATLADLRKKAGFSTQPALAKASGVGRATIANLERGVFGDVKLATLDALAAALRVDPDRVRSAIGRPATQRKPPKRAPRRRLPKTG